MCTFFQVTNPGCASKNSILFTFWRILAGNGKSGNHSGTKVIMSKAGAPRAQTSRPEEIKMLKNRLFNVLMIVALVAIVVVTISQAVATIRVVSAAPASRDTVSAGADQLLAADQCAILAG